MYAILCTNSRIFSECSPVHMRRNSYERPSCILGSTGLKIKKVDLVSVHTWHQPSKPRGKRPYVGSRREFSQVHFDRSDFTHFNLCTETKNKNRSDTFRRDLNQPPNYVPSYPSCLTCMQIHCKYLSNRSKSKHDCDRRLYCKLIHSSIISSHQTLARWCR